MEEGREDVYGFLRISMKKKIVILSAFLTPFRSGAEACAEEVPLALADEYDFTIITCRLRRSLPKNDMLQGRIVVKRIGIGCSFDKWLFPFLAPVVVAHIQPDTIHAILETFAGLALAFCKAPKKILTCQTTNRSFLKRFIVRRADQVTVISTALGNLVKKHRSDEIIQIPNGIHFEVFAKARKEHKKIPGRILFVGRLEQQKGIDTLLKAFPQLQGDVHLRIVGDGSKRSSLQSLMKQLNIADRVTFTGRVEPDQIAAEYAQAEIFCGLSRSEALGNVFIEAQAGGCAIVATNVGGIVDTVIEGEQGLLVSPDMVNQASDALQHLLVDQDLQKRFAKNGIAHAAMYDWKDIAAQYAKLY